MVISALMGCGAAADNHNAVNGAILNGNNGVVDLVANGDLRVVLLCI